MYIKSSNSISTNFNRNLLKPLHFSRRWIRHCGIASGFIYSSFTDVISLTSVMLLVIMKCRTNSSWDPCMEVKDVSDWQIIFLGHFPPLYRFQVHIHSTIVVALNHPLWRTVLTTVICKAYSILPTWQIPFKRNTEVACVLKPKSKMLSSW